ncbi:MAG: hypothetical protein EBZ15_04865 [Actinobacteria bacterium]|nr:hypothetical protein [Actinomycetota bacterium]
MDSAASAQMTTSGTLGAHAATRSPGSTPARRMRAATDATSERSSPRVQDWRDPASSIPTSTSAASSPASSVSTMLSWASGKNVAAAGSSGPTTARLPRSPTTPHSSHAHDQKASRSFILFSSGTTGAPKCIVHSAAGVLIKDLAEQRIHLDITPGDRVCYYTTAGWMMWNWLVMALGTGATVVLVDGQPMYPEPDRLLRLVADEKLTFLGVSAKYIESLRQHSVSMAPHELTSLRTMASTGSPLAPELFDYVYEHVCPSVHLASISGGTDICGCFVLGVPTEPVRRGEIQGPALGLDVRAVDDVGADVPVGVRGELVCTTPFPSRPIGFWGDDDGSRFRAAYFERFPGVWAHGDFISRSDAGGFVIHGRSDATLNSGGVRIGTAEIYRVVDALADIEESIVVGQRDGLDTRIVLFIVLREGANLDEELHQQIRQALRSAASPRHVPAEIVAVPSVPRTVTGKLAELAVTDIVNGDPVRNTSGLIDPSALEAFRVWVGTETSPTAG